MTFADKFLKSGMEKSMIDEYFRDRLKRAGYDGMKMEDTPNGVRIILKVDKPGMAIGKKGSEIREMTDELKDRFDIEDLSIDVQEVDEPFLSATIVADKLGNALERGWYFRQAGQKTTEDIMNAGAKGTEIMFSGKLQGARSSREKFKKGYIKYSGEPSKEIVEHGESRAIMPLGSIGVQVKIIPPNAEFPDNFEVYDDVDFDENVNDIDSLIQPNESNRDSKDNDKTYPEEEVVEEN